MGLRKRRLLKRGGGGNQPVTFSLSRNGVATQANGWNFDDLGLLGEVLGNLTATNGGTAGTNENDLKKYLCTTMNGNGTTAGGNDCESKGLDKIAEDLRGNTNALTTIKAELQGAIIKTAEKEGNSTALDILGSIVENIDPKDIAGLVEGVQGGNAELKTILGKIGGSVKISKGTSPALDSLFTIVNTINKNSLNISLK